MSRDIFGPQSGRNTTRCLAWGACQRSSSSLSSSTYFLPFLAFSICCHWPQPLPVVFQSLLTLIAVAARISKPHCSDFLIFVGVLFPDLPDYFERQKVAATVSIQQTNNSMTKDYTLCCNLCPGDFKIRFQHTLYPHNNAVLAHHRFSGSYLRWWFQPQHEMLVMELHDSETTSRVPYYPCSKKSEAYNRHCDHPILIFPSQSDHELYSIHRKHALERYGMTTCLCRLGLMREIYDYKINGGGALCRWQWESSAMYRSKVETRSQKPKVSFRW